jgi:chromosome segregation ATPase
MRNSLTKTTGRAPLTAISSANNSFAKSATMTQRSAKPSIARLSTSSNGQSILRPGSAKPQQNTDRKFSVLSSKPSSHEEISPELLELSNKNKPEVAIASSRVEDKIIGFQIAKNDSNLNTLEANVLIKDHESCYKKQQELMDKFKTENEVQNQDIANLRSEISRWKEISAKSDAEILDLKGKNLSINNSSNNQEDTIVNLRREILLLQRKVENSHEVVANSQMDSIKLKREILNLKGEMEELRALAVKEKNEKEQFWSQLQDESKKHKELTDKNVRFKDESRNLIQLIENMRDEIKELRVSNEEALKFIQNK